MTESNTSTATSFWVGVSREDWPSVVAANQPRMNGTANRAIYLSTWAALMARASAGANVELPKDAA